MQLLRTEHRIERGAQIAGAGRTRIIGVVGENLEETPADDRVAMGHGGCEVGIADGDDLKIAIEHQEESGADSNSSRKSGGVIPSHASHHCIVTPQEELSCTHSRAISTSSSMSNGFARILQIRCRNSQLS